MNHTTVLRLGTVLLLLCLTVQAALKDFIVGPDMPESDQFNELDLGCAAEQQLDPEMELISYRDLEQDGQIDTQLLLRALMQHAQRMGLNLEQLAEMQGLEQEDSFDSDMSCGAAAPLSYGQQPSWYDVFFN